MDTARIAVVSFTPGGKALGEKVVDALKQPLANKSWTAVCAHRPKPLGEWCRKQFDRCDALLFIGAMGIAVRSIAPLLRSKTTDPAVLAADERGIHLISVLSGHLGGGNELTLALADRLGADPVITTASDVNGTIAIDVFAKKNGLYLESMEKAKRAAAAILAGKRVKLFCDGRIVGQTPLELSYDGEQEDFLIRISPSVPGLTEHTLHLIPKALVLGIGCRRGVTREQIEERVLEELNTRELSIHSVLAAATIDLKEEEAGLLEFCGRYQIPIAFYPAKRLMEAPGAYPSSEFVRRVTGADNVCGRAAALRAAEAMGRPVSDRELILEKSGRDGVAIALARIDWSVEFE